ncbi:type VI secretion system contractile sheath large subunit [Inquilinus limosus]|uniref:type VI secretion system contractile sheath large subunit n=1 Tax=Inquilinus limosus TaxID=171674 RepID=UPI003F178AD9
MSSNAVTEQTATGTAVVTTSSLLDEILQKTQLRPSDDGYDVARKGVAAFVSELLKPSAQNERINVGLVDNMVAEIDLKLGAQVNEILHAPAFQRLESAWRSVKFLVDRTDFRQNIRLNLLTASREELLQDFEDSPEISKSGLYKHVYTNEFGQFGGRPFAAMVADIAFGPGSQDIKLLQDMSAVAAMSHAPLIGGASPEFFGLDTYEGLANLRDIQAILEGPKFAKWRAFRDSEDSRYVGLAMPRFLLREPYHPGSIQARSFNFDEEAAGRSENYLWGNAAFALASRLTESFAKYRWCPNIIGPQSGGTVEDMPVHLFESMGQTQAKIPTEVLISDRREYELAEQGFVPLTMRKDSNNAAFFSANSVKRPKVFANTPEGKAEELNYRLGTQLPYLFIVSRLAHYIKVMQRENIGSWKSRTELESELSNWIRQYVSDQENPSASVRSRRPLRRAEIKVEDVEGEPGWFRVSMTVQPHFKYMGADFSLSLVGKLDKA